MHRQRIAAIAMAAAFAFAACGGGASPTPAGSAATTSPASSAATTSPAADGAVAIAGFAFDPPSLTVKVGSSVTWTNEDAAAHTVAWSDGTPGSGTLTKGGDPYARTFDQPGTFAYACGIHPSMKGTIVVEP
jgi:plastocyanin